jgi:hypothetical protein
MINVAYIQILNSESMPLRNSKPKTTEVKVGDSLLIK